MNEAQTKHDLIEPALREAGWGIIEGSRLRLEFPITNGRLIGQNRRATPLFADYVLEYKNRRIGIVEAKKRDLYYTKDTQIISFFERSKERFCKKEILSPSDIEHLFMSNPGTKEITNNKKCKWS